MKRYVLSTTKTTLYVLEVTAESEEQARVLAAYIPKREWEVFNVEYSETELQAVLEPLND